MPTAIISDARVRRTDFVERHLSALRDMIVDPVFRFSSKSTLYTLPMQPDEVGNCFHPFPRSFFDSIVVAAGLPLYRTSVAQDVLARAHNALKPGGQLLIASETVESDPTSILLSPADLAKLFGALAERDGYYVVDRDATDLTVDRSVLSAYWACRGDLILDQILGGSIWNAEVPYVDARFGKLLEGGAETAVKPLRPRREAIVEIVELYRAGKIDAEHPYDGRIMVASPDWSFREDASQLASTIDGWLRYRLWGVYYKVAVMKKVLRDRFGPSYELDVVEHGGNVGLVPLQLLLEPDLTVKHVVNSEISNTILMAGATLVEQLGERVRGKYAFAFGAAEDYRYTRTYDVVSFTHCLLYLRRDLLEGTLRRSYDALRPGGVLVILENTAPPTGTTGRDADIIFSPEELDSLLGRIAPVAYFDVKTGLPTTQEGSTLSPVLRTLSKA